MAERPDPWADLDEEQRRRYREWARTWARAGAEMARIRWAELRAMTQADMERALAALFADQTPAPPKRRSGLVALQRALHRTR